MVRILSSGEIVQDDDPRFRQQSTPAASRRPEVNSKLFYWQTVICYSFLYVGHQSQTFTSQYLCLTHNTFIGVKMNAITCAAGSSN